MPKIQDIYFLGLHRVYDAMMTRAIHVVQHIAAEKYRASQAICLVRHVLFVTAFSFFVVTSEAAPPMLNIERSTCEAIRRRKHSKSFELFKVKFATFNVEVNKSTGTLRF